MDLSSNPRGKDLRHLAQPDNKIDIAVPADTLNWGCSESKGQPRMDQGGGDMWKKFLKKTRIRRISLSKLLVGAFSLLGFEKLYALNTNNERERSGKQRTLGEPPPT